jgi:cytochrome c oxidase cbb3-type subunit 3
MNTGRYKEGAPFVKATCPEKGRGVCGLSKRLLVSVGAFVCGAVFAAAPLRAQFPRAVVDPAEAERGAKLYASNCARCHGDDARGTPTGPDMLRSEVILKDRREVLHGKELGPLLRTLPQHNFKFNDKEVVDLSQFFTQNINKILRSGYNDQPTGLLSGDAKAGEAYFNGAGGCNKCHSPTGNLAGVAKKYTTAALQQKFLFPGSGLRGAPKLQVTVKSRGGPTYAGDVVRLDDFNVTLRGADGITRSFSRTPGTVVTTVDPVAAHNALLTKYTDSDIHNMTAYLDTLK